VTNIHVNVTHVYATPPYNINAKHIYTTYGPYWSIRDATLVVSKSTLLRIP